jgi:excisionase family DNA binding protein
MVIMAGMFYSLQEAADKLKVTKEQVADLVKQGRLREFRVGENVSLKVSEVEALMTDQSIMPPAQPPAEPQLQSQPEEQPQQPPQPETIQVPQPQPEIEPEQPPQPEAVQELQPQPEAEPPLQAPQQPQPQAETKPQPPAQPEAMQEPQPNFELEPSVGPEPEMAADSGEISLAPEASLGDDTGDELLNADTFVSGDGINVLGETDGTPLDTHEMLAETKGSSGAEPSLEEIEEDVNLDTFGSGSGLLDLSLQADDTSLGGILDEIYTSESGQETSETSAIDLAPEAEAAAPIIPEEDMMAGPEPMPVVEEMPAMAPAVYAAAAPDRLSTWLGYLLWLPVLAILYTAIVAVAGFNKVMPAVLAKLQAIDGPYGVHIIWYIAGGAALLSLAMVGLSLAMGAPGAKAPKKPKVKTPKAPKPPKKPKEPKKKKEKKK